MQKIHFHFDLKKATQALNWFAGKSGGSINKMKALKLIYLADRFHLRKYGRLITNDSYFAMDYGPVPSGVKDLAEASDFLGSSEQQYSEQFIRPVDQYTLESKQPADNTVFSESDIEALNFAWNTFSRLEAFELAKLTHEYPEWKKHAETLKTDSRIQMNILDFLEDPDTGIEKCFTLSPDDKAAKIDHINETACIESLWS
jgi:uncharacterized phage-associated protein